MARSMTAFARRERQAQWGKLAWELRGVNHRYLEIHPRLPEDLRFLEGDLRQRVAEQLGRGKVECVLRYQAAPGQAGGLRLNEGYAQQVADACAALAGKLDHAAPVSPLELLRTPGVVEEEQPDLAPVADAALELLGEALAELDDVRGREGRRLAELVRERVDGLQRLAEDVRARRAEVNEGVRERLLARIEDLGLSADPGRVEQEVAIVAQRLDVAEELDRLLTHVEEVRRVLATEGLIGRRLDFLMQELNREANTLSSKSADTRTTKAAVEMKVLIEQMREQIQNIE